MKKINLIICFIVLIVSACNKEDERVFEQTADERSAAAISDLKSKLVVPANGWRVRYTPSTESGSYYVLLNFNEDNKVNIKTDLSTNNGEFYDQTVPYRIDSSLGLELVFETYSFFSLLFELDETTFGGEFEFDYVNETPEGALVFSSRSDGNNSTRMVLEPAAANDVSLLGNTLSSNIITLGDDLFKFSSSLRINYVNKDLAIYLSMDPTRRTVNFNYVGLISDVQNGKSLNLSTGFIVSGNSIIFDEPLVTTFQGTSLTIEQVNLSGPLSETAINLCNEPITLHNIPGSITSTGDNIVLETTLFDPNGGAIFERSNYFYAPIGYFTRDGIGIGQEIVDNLPGAVEMDLIYNLQLNDGTTLSGLGFVIANEDNSSTIALKEFETNIVDNNITFTFKEGYRLFGNTEVEMNYEKMDEYINLMTEGNSTLIFRYNPNIFEFYNPCNRFNIVFFAAN